ncbi:MAG: hypothetical protein FWG98_12150 [Candidatus Cloacimonetes bacterium]|nr:hypothetical protein [Candidatus Cloacimonadota bacterium]
MADKTIAMADDKTQMMDKTDLPLHTEGVDSYVERMHSLIFFSCRRYETVVKNRYHSFHTFGMVIGCVVFGCYIAIDTFGVGRKFKIINKEIVCPTRQ